MMIDKRVRFSKKGEAKYISHLDLYRFMLRALKRTGLPVWHTEGFNPHVYVTFALPLSLGQCGLCEIMDFRITESVTNAEIMKRLNDALPPNIRVTAVYNPIHKPKEIVSAEYEIILPEAASFKDQISSFLTLKYISVEKKTKKGTSIVNLAEHLISYEVSADEHDVYILVKLPTGTQLNINPSLLVDALEDKIDKKFEPVTITRRQIFIENNKTFD